MGISKTSDYVQIKIKIPNPSQVPPASSKAQNEDLKDMDFLCTFKIKIESQNLAYGSNPKLIIAKLSLFILTLKSIKEVILSFQNNVIKLVEKHYFW